MRRPFLCPSGSLPVRAHRWYFANSRRRRFQPPFLGDSGAADNRFYAWPHTIAVQASIQLSVRPWLWSARRRCRQCRHRSPWPWRRIARRHAGAEIEDLEAAGGEDGRDQVFADVVDIAAACRGRPCPRSHARSRVQHFRFKNLHGSLHRFGRSQQIGQKHLAAPELIAGEGDAAANPWFTASSGSTPLSSACCANSAALSGAPSMTLWRIAPKSGSDTELRLRSAEGSGRSGADYTSATATKM